MLVQNGKAAPNIIAEPTSADSSRSQPHSPMAEHSVPQAPQASPPQGPGATETSIPAMPRAVDVPNISVSVIGEDLTILGQDVRVVSKGKIRVDGEIQGDVLGTEVVIGDIGKVAGVVSAETITVFGSIMGTIRGARVLLEAGARVEGDVHHQTLSVHEGAQIEGRVRRARDPSELRLDAADNAALS